MGKWLIVLCGVPLTYLVLPISCCVRNPAAVVLFDNNKKEEKINFVVENIAAGLSGLIGCVYCCGCCLGECGHYGPKEF